MNETPLGGASSSVANSCWSLRQVKFATLTVADILVVSVLWATFDVWSV
jgi:hypothetical protein